MLACHTKIGSSLFQVLSRLYYFRNILQILSQLGIDEQLLMKLLLVYRSVILLIELYRTTVEEEIWKRGFRVFYSKSQSTFQLNNTETVPIKLRTELRVPFNQKAHSPFCACRFKEMHSLFGIHFIYEGWWSNRFALNYFLFTVCSLSMSKVILAISEKCLAKDASFRWVIIQNVLVGKCRKRALILPNIALIYFKRKYFIDISITNIIEIFPSAKIPL